MQRLRLWQTLVGRLSIRWRLALASFGLLAIVLAALGTFVSLTEEHALLANQATMLRSEAQLVDPTSLKEAGRSRASELRVLAPLTKGTYTLTAQADPTNWVPELTELNNNRAAPITIN